MKRIQRITEQLESRQLMASDWQNLSLIRDVDSSGLVTPLDALILVNSINALDNRQPTIVGGMSP